MDSVNGKGKGSDFYNVLGLGKDCSTSDLRLAYKKLALKWHPDRCSAIGDLEFVEEAKRRFQEIQQAYSVLSDEKKRFLYDVGMHGSDSEDEDDDENGMSEFMGEMAAMMSQTKPNEKGESFEDLQTLFEEMFQNDIAAFSSMSQSSSSSNNGMFSSSSSSYYENFNSNNKRNCSNMNSAQINTDFDSETCNLQNFCFEATADKVRTPAKGGSSRRRTGRKQKVSGQHDVSSCDTKISV